jgi:hypothetical protein
MNQKEFHDQFDFKEEPTFRNRIRFIMRDSRYNNADKLEYLSYMLFGLVAIAFNLLLLVFSFSPKAGIKLALEIGYVLILGFYILILAWRKIRKIEERFVYPYRVWVGGEEYSQKAPVFYNQIMYETVIRGQEKGKLAFIWTSRLFFGLYIVFYISVIFFLIIYPLPTEFSSVVILGGGIIFIIGLIILSRDIHRYFQAVRQDPKLIIPFSLLVIFIGASIGLVWLYLIRVIQISIPLER